MEREIIIKRVEHYPTRSKIFSENEAFNYFYNNDEERIKNAKLLKENLFIEADIS